ncbi:putative UDP-N-acetylglucosamine--peptide N-acetylglucosaminyltransferase SEC [Apostasia shenzhenica]|uniref:Putative UDP-N-acetylglucosamine--peptide N-acetylglucosaminyltransferase SEC n=1 Tax=Apostasia shenzhenica TaxID=1088818 RepID=A0A2I0AE93_9ASPA|nr:putative UDP-N-acetylglucosamine--peptide N-acetylglucosaminyltransferase SEC [Apostasia shenzhenica]
MPGIIMDESDRNQRNVGSNELNSPHFKDNLVSKSPRDVSASSNTPRTDPLDLPTENCADTSIDRLFNNVCEMESSTDGSPHQTFGSDGEESRIDSELCHLAGGKVQASEVVEEGDEINSSINTAIQRKNQTNDSKSPSKSSISSKKSRRPSQSQMESENSLKSTNAETDDTATKPIKKIPGKKPKIGSEDRAEDGPEVGPFLLKHARDLISSDNHRRALKYAVRAAKVFERIAEGKPNLDLVMSLHVIAAIHCSMGKYSEAIPLLEKSIEIPDLEAGKEHFLAKFSGYMQLGDTYAMMGQLGTSIQCYKTAIEIQKQALGAKDPRVGETCRYLAEAYMQALEFDKAENLCKMALDIHKDNGEDSSLEETADRRLMGLICDAKGDHESALEHLLLASMAMAADGRESEVAFVDCGIGDIYLSLARYDEAVMAYKKALSVFISSKGEAHPNVALIFVRLADLYNKTGKFKESKSHCENALHIYSKPTPGTTPEEIASGLTDVSAIYELMNEHEQALNLLQKALKMYNNAPGYQNTIAGIEAQMGVLYYILGNFSSSYDSFKSAITKLRTCGERKSAFFGIALNQMGLACVQRYAINEAADLFEEARTVLEQEYGLYHPETLGVYSNLAGTYDAMGRLDEAIELLEHIVAVREDKLGTANPDVDDEKRRLAELLKEAGRGRSRRAKSLEYLLDANSHILKKDITAV